MVVLLLVVAVLVVSYASSMRAYLHQREHIADLRAQIASSQQRIDELSTEKKRWQDPSYVEQQARQRFGWVLPGETAYQVIGRDGKPLTSDGLDEPSAPVTTPTAWWKRAYVTLEQADHPPKPGDKPRPLDKIGPDEDAPDTAGRG